MSEIVKAYTDGACRGNPGPGRWGVLLQFGKHEKRLYGGEKDSTNNRMELMAAIMALESLKRSSKVIIVTDSQYVMNGITSWIKNWKKRNWKTAANKPVKNIDLWQRLESASALHEVSWDWVRGHSGHIENEIADELANQGIDTL